MPIRDPVILALVGSAVATLFYLLERRRRDRWTALDRFASRHGMSCERMPPLSSLAPQEPIGLVPPVVAIERMVSGVLRAGPLVTGATLHACLTGNRHQARPFLLGVFAGPQEMPTLRIVPPGDKELRDDLGFAAMPAEGLPPGLEAQSFQPLSRRLTVAIGAELAKAPGFRAELRPGRLLLATAVEGPERPERIDQMMELGLSLLRAIEAALTAREEPPAPAVPVAGGGLLN